jgi:hypothetical protein
MIIANVKWQFSGTRLRSRNTAIEGTTRAAPLPLGRTTAMDQEIR